MVWGHSPTWPPVRSLSQSHTAKRSPVTSPLPPKAKPQVFRGSSALSVGLGYCTLQGPLKGAVEVQRGLSGEASSEVNVADACDPHGMATTAIDLAQAQVSHHQRMGPQHSSLGQEATNLTQPCISSWNPAFVDTRATYLLPRGPAQCSPNEGAEAPAYDPNLSSTLEAVLPLSSPQPLQALSVPLHV